ncbi:MAG: S-layer homology domain-containing protein [Clostridia bacterium]|nr:S-layer homology domain-containing protein [Clostridia bacterium]
MKKFIFMTLMFSVFLIFNTAAFAATLSAGFEYDSVNNGFYVNGESDDTLFGDMVTVKMYLNDEPFNVEICKTQEKEGSKVFKTDFIPLGITTPDGEIYFEVSSVHTSNTFITDSFNYYGVKTLLPVLQKLQTEINSKSLSGFKKVINENNNKLSLDVDYLNKNNINSDAVMESYLSKYTLSLPNNISNEDDFQKAYEELIKFKKQYSQMFMYSRFACLENNGEFIKWYNDYKNQIDIDNIDGSDEFEAMYNKNEFSEILSTYKSDITEIETMRDKLIEIAMLTKIYTSNSAGVKSVCEKFADKISMKYSNSLSEIQKVVVYEKLAGNKYVSYLQLAQAYDKFAYECLYSNNSSNGSGGGYSGGSAYIPVADKGKDDEIVPTDNTPAENMQPFTDMDNYKWAQKAVEYLYEKKIISGVGDGLFKPEANITRAEFIKMVVIICGLDISDTADSVFNDINIGDWYIGYINAAQKSGIIKGDTNNNANPNEYIKRQDMAIILYRAKHINDIVKNENVFIDENDISDYAKNAVLYWNSVGVINGMDNGAFLPLDNATRAQSAQMLYNLIMLG